MQINSFKGASWGWQAPALPFVSVLFLAFPKVQACGSAMGNLSPLL